MTAHSAPSGAQDYERMMTMLTGFWVTQIVRAAATFNVADHLAAGTDTAEAIAAEESIDPAATRRLIRACASWVLSRRTMVCGSPGRPCSARCCATTRTRCVAWSLPKPRLVIG